jgi:thiol-disulfide isomerase/thioredoxin
MTWTAVIWIGALVTSSTALGLLWRWRTGRARSIPARTLDLPGVTWGTAATLLQFSTPICAGCPPTRRILGGIAAETPGVRHEEIDLGARPELAARFHILQTPTTFVVDDAGVVRARIGGAPRPDVVRAALAPVLTRSA